MRRAVSFFLLCSGIPLAAFGADAAGVEFFEKQVRPVLAARCYACHSSQAPQLQGGLRLDSRAGWEKGGHSGALVDRAQPERSLLLRALRHQDKDLKMPPGKPLAPELIAAVEQWVRMGAPMPEDKPAAAGGKGKSHWSLQPVHKREPPSDPEYAGIDAFIAARLREKGLAMAPAADARTLIRRVTYDLTGLPPTYDEVKSFERDSSPEAYRRLVDRLLASPQYGERWARHWLDVARYSDARNTGERFPYAYTYRDWVIQALNEDMPYDRFVLNQIAADQVTGNAPRNLAALGFLSLGRTFPKSFPETVDDRIDTVSRGLLGLTVSCARCHDHKYDPIPTADYYSFYSIFSNLKEPEELPLLGKPAGGAAKDRRYQARMDAIRRQDSEYRSRRLSELKTFFRDQTPEYLLAVRDARDLSNTGKEELVRERQLNLHMLERWRKYLAAPNQATAVWLAASQASDAEFAAHFADAVQSAAALSDPRIVQHFSGSKPASARDLASEYGKLLLSLTGVQHGLNSPESPLSLTAADFELVYSEGDGNNTRRYRDLYESVHAMYAYDGAAPRAMALVDVAEPKVAHVFVRGNPNNPGAETPPHFLSCLTQGEPGRFERGSGRLELAQSIVNSSNPLTARVMVNRIWLGHFGAGLVLTPSDYGIRGEAPSHPELLDYLAERFISSGWKMKALHREIVLSAAYRQSSQDRPEARKLDPENRLLWRMNRQRLDIEALRDSMLSVAGSMQASGGGPAYSLTALPAVPRRTVYGYVERGRVPGFLSSFDFASPDQHVPMRIQTTVPQQALYLLNSSFVAGQAREAAIRTPEAAPAERIRHLYRRILARDPVAGELAAGLKFLSPGQDTTQGSEPADGPWQYGFGAVNSTGDRASFTPFPYFTGNAYQGASMLPDPKAGNAHLRATGGQPGDDPAHAAIRRWVSPVKGKVSVQGTLRHRQADVRSGDGVRGRILSSRHGLLALFQVDGRDAETKLSGIEVQPGDTIDFVVDGRDDAENDDFTWEPVISLQGGERTVWEARSGFREPAAIPLPVWARYAQVLLDSNEFAFVD